MDANLGHILLAFGGGHPGFRHDSGNNGAATVCVGYTIFHS